MIFRNLLAATAALSLVASPALAQQSANIDRVSAPVSKESKLVGNGILLAILAAAAVIGGIIIAADDGDETPISA